MKSFFSVIFLLLQLQAINLAFAQTECADNSQKPNICSEAKAIAEKIAKQLPLQMSQDMSWESVKAVENTIEGLLQLTYDKVSLETFLTESGSNMEQARSAMREAALMVCREGSPTRSFISGGGAMRYDYRFADGEQFFVVEIGECR
jgi:hypothetical protein